MSELLAVNVNAHTEKKGQLTYLSWAWAWAEVLKVDPKATWVVHTYGPQGSEQPCMWIGETAMVHVSVTVNGLRRECMLPVMDNRNNAMKNPDSRKVSDAIMRCMTKAISMHGLGLYIYAGEDLPEDGKPEPEGDVKPPIPASFRSSPLMDADGRPAIDLLEPEQQEHLRDLAMDVVGLLAQQGVEAAMDRLHAEHLDNEQRMGLWSILDSKTRAAIKKAAAQPAAKTKPAIDINPHTGGPTLASVTAAEEAA